MSYLQHIHTRNGDVRGKKHDPLCFFLRVTSEQEANLTVGEAEDDAVVVGCAGQVEGASNSETERPGGYLVSTLSNVNFGAFRLDCRHEISVGLGITLLAVVPNLLDLEGVKDGGEAPYVVGVRMCGHHEFKRAVHVLLQVIDDPWRLLSAVYQDLGLPEVKQD